MDPSPFDADGALADLHVRFPHGVVERDGAVVGFWSTVGAHLRSPAVECLGRSARGGPVSFVAVPIGHADGVASWVESVLADPDAPPSPDHAGSVRHERRSDFVRTLRALIDNLVVGQTRSRAPVREALGTHRPAPPRPVGTDLVARHGADVARDFVRFLRTLDLEAVEVCLPRCGGLRLTEAHWPGLDASFGLGAPLRRAMADVPEHASTLVDAWGRDQARFVDAWRSGGARAVAYGHLVADGTWPAWLPRRVEAARAAWDAHGEGASRPRRAPRGGICRAYPPHDPFATGMGVAGWFPADWVPSTHEDWMAFLDLRLLVEDASALVGRGDLARFTDVRGRWAQWSARLQATAGRPARELGPALRSSIDVVHALARQVVVPAVALAHGRPDGVAAASERARACLWRILHGRRTLNGVLGSSARWHARQGAILDGMEALPGRVARLADGWVPGLPDLVHGDVTLKVLATPRELREEGARTPNPDGTLGLSHCVGGYAPGCRAGTSRIVSLRRTLPDGSLVRSSTADLDVSRRTVTLSEHRGPGNSAPPDDCVMALRAYMAHVADGRAVDWTAFVAMDDAGDAIVADAGYDLWREGNHAAVVALWEPVLPRHLRGLDALGWAEVAGRFTAPEPNTDLA